MFITLALRPMTLLHKKYQFRPGESPINAGHEAEYFNRPLPGKKLIVTGRIKEKYLRRDRPYVVLEFDVKDEDGRPIERMRRITMNRASSLGKNWWARSPKDAEIGAEIEPLVKAITLESMREAEDIAAINPLGNNTNIHNDAETAARAGLRGLAVTTPARSPALPDLPTLVEAGVRGVEVVAWYGMMTTAGTPRAIVDRVSSEIGNAMRHPDMVKRLRADGSEAIANSPEEFRALLIAEREKWDRVIKQAGIKPE